MKNGKSIRGALSYNESKLRAGKAELILAARFACDATELSFSQKLKRFTLLNDNCSTTACNTVHISLNFAPGEILSITKMQDIARDYMQMIGFEKQPYLVYRHDDSGHPHVHIVTTPIRASGRSINLHNLVQRKSEPARKAIEIRYNLVQAQGRSLNEELSKMAAPKAIYGKTATKQAISQIVRSVTETYRFTSFEAFNLILKQFNIVADKGNPGTRLNTHKGLQYFMLDGQGNKIGVPVKASAIYTRPTLATLEKLYDKNKVKKERVLPFTRRFLQYALTKSKNEKAFIDLLASKKIQLLSADSGELYFLDTRNKIVCSLNEAGILPADIEKLEAAENKAFKINIALIGKLFDHTYTSDGQALHYFKKKRKKRR